MNSDLKKSLSIVNYAGIASVALLLACTTAFGVFPLLKRGTADIHSAADITVSLNRFSGLSNTLTEVDQQRAQSENRLTEQEKRLPASLEASAFNAELTTVAKTAGIRIESMPNQQTFTDDGPYKSLPVTIIGSGDWESCYRFLTGIKNMNRLTRLDSVVINVPEREGQNLPPDAPSCQITVRFSTFFLER